MMNFIVYLLAMLGIIILALFVYKKFNVNSLGIKNNHSLKIEDALSLSARKTLYVIRNGSERFLIAADMERTTLISKLDNNSEVYIEPQQRRQRKNVDLSDEGIRMQDNVAPMKRPIMKEIKSKLF
ncbi:flagellar biosynthetic protein FliO [bacterium]|nr:flagellar biosynthetic protein FliO [bacterium]